MKKILFPILIMISVLNIISVKAKTCDPNKISIESISIEEKGDNVEEIEEATSTEKNIKLNLSMSKVGDNIKYKIIIKNASEEDYKLNENSFNIESDYINYSLESEDNTNIVKANTSKIIYLRVEYKNKIPDELMENDSYNDNKTLTINLSDSNEIINPDTKRNTIVLLVVILITSTIFIMPRSKKYITFLIIVITIPIAVHALCDVDIQIESQVKIIKRPLIKIITPNRTKDTLQVGDEICINGDTTECFNFIGYDGNNIKMLSKWNLKVGNIYNSENSKIGEYTSSDEGYGLQSSDVRGKVDGASTYNGTIPFSKESYWDDNNSPKSDYPGTYHPGPDYPVVFDSTNYKGTSGSNDYSVAYYVNEYKTKLITYGVIVQDARLLTYAEATDTSIGCNQDSRTCPTSEFIKNTTFWLGSAYTRNALWSITSNGRLAVPLLVDNKSTGVRPVIVISRSDI